MIYNPDIHHRKSIRLRGYDYCRAGAYFVAICAWRRECLFGEVVDGEMVKNECGGIVWDEWRKSATIREEIELDEFVIMPNHVHGIVFIVRATGRSPLRGIMAIYPGHALDQLVRLWPGSNPLSANGSTKSAIPQASLCGSAIITNTSSETMRN